MTCVLLFLMLPRGVKVQSGLRTTGLGLQKVDPHLQIPRMRARLQSGQTFAVPSGTVALQAPLFQVMTDNLHLGKNDWEWLTSHFPRSICIFTRGLFGQRSRAVVDWEEQVTKQAQISFQRFMLWASRLGPWSRTPVLVCLFCPEFPEVPAYCSGLSLFHSFIHLSERGSWDPSLEGCAPVGGPHTTTEDSRNEVLRPRS